MLKVQRSANGHVVFTVSGRLGEGNIGELETLFKLETNGRRIVLDLKDVTLVDQEVVSFLDRCESDGITLKNTPAYIREWIMRQRDGS